MLSFEKCRELIGIKSIADQEVEAIRDQMYALAELLIDKYLEARNMQDEDQRKAQN